MSTFSVVFEQYVDSNDISYMFNGGVVMRRGLAAGVGIGTNYLHLFLIDGNL